VKSSEIFVGDLIRVVDALGLKASMIERAASLLGFALPVPDLARPEQKLKPLPVSVKLPAPPPTNRPDDQPAKTPILLEPVRRDTVDASPPAWLDSGVLRPAPAETDADLSFDPPYEPLFAPGQTRHILSAALATRLLEGEIDGERIVLARARREPIRIVPRRSVPSVRRGVQVLLDRRDALMPFFADQNHLVSTLSAVIGADRISVLQFLRRPTRVLSPEGLREQDYELPPSGTPILLVTDLAIGVPPLSPHMLSVDEWGGFARRAAGARCPVVAFVPYPARRWPTNLRGAINIVQWDRSTTAGDTHRRVGRGLRVSA
jgi:hypothetical protein